MVSELPPRRPDDRAYPIRSYRLKLRQYRSQIVWRVLAINQEPVEVRAGTDLRRIGIGK